MLKKPDTPRGWVPSTNGEPDRQVEIVAIDCFPVRLPMKKPLTIATHQLTSGPVLYVRIRARCGAEGWGEAGTDPVMSGETLLGMVGAVEQLLKPLLIGTSVFDRVAKMAFANRRIYGNGSAKAAVDMALLDLAGRLLCVPAVELLGGARRARAPVLRLVGGSGDAEVDVQEVRALFDAGFYAFKLKVGVARLEHDAETVRRLREELGPDILIAADANMAWSTASARRFATLVAPYNVEFLEQPVEAGNTRGMANLTEKTAMSISADEGMHGMQDMLALVQANAISGVSLKTMKFGGVTAVMSAATVADAIGLSVNVAMLVESSLASAAMTHVACAAPNVEWGLSLGSLLIADGPTTGFVRCERGDALCPEGPGLGVTVDEARLAEFAAE